MRETIKENGINLNFHKFQFETKKNKHYKFEERLLFTFLNNKELDLEKSGINNLYNILSTKYDYTDYSVSTNLKHQIIFEEIQRLSKRNFSIPSQNERSKSFIMIDIFSTVSFSSSPKEKVTPQLPTQRHEEEPFVDVNDLLKNINEKNELNQIFERNEIENILEDLHKLGLIVYFKKKYLGDTFISNPQWFNNLFKSVLDIGRKRVGIIFESIYNKLKETKNKKMKDKILKIIMWLKGKSKLDKLEDIWCKRKELEKSKLDKISFESLLIKLEEIIGKLIEKKEFSIFEIEELKNYSTQLSQNLIFVDEATLSSELINKVLKNYRRKGKIIFNEKKLFLMNLLSQINLISPTKRLNQIIKGKTILHQRIFILPLLFSSQKSSSFSSSLNNATIGYSLKDLDDIVFENEWIVDYFLPFKPSTVWKLLFTKIRTSCVGFNESDREILKEMYWSNGFSFYLVENDSSRVKTFLELEFIEDRNNLGHVLMKTTIKIDLKDLNLFYSTLHQTIQTFVKEWIVSDFYNKILIKLSRVKETRESVNIQSNLKIPGNFELKNNFEHFDENENCFKCFNCGFSIHFQKKHAKCVNLIFIFNIITYFLKVTQKTFFSTINYP